MKLAPNPTSEELAEELRSLGRESYHKVLRNHGIPASRTRSAFRCFGWVSPMMNDTWNLVGCSPNETLYGPVGDRASIWSRSSKKLNSMSAGATFYRSRSSRS